MDHGGNNSSVLIASPMIEKLGIIASEMPSELAEAEEADDEDCGGSNPAESRNEPDRYLELL